MPLPSHLKTLLGRSIAFRPVLAELTESLTAGLLLSQATYWATRTKDPNGWFYKTQADWCAETGLTRAEQAKARAQLRRFAFWQEQRRGVPATLYYRVDLPLLTAALESPPDVTLEQVLRTCATALQRLSKTGYMRAHRANVGPEFVDYAAVLQTCGMICGVCQQPIIRALGALPGCLTFAYRLSLSQGGGHTLANLHPAHVACATPKSTDASPAQICYRKKSEMS